MEERLGKSIDNIYPYDLSEEEKEEQEYRELLMAKALFYVVKEPRNYKRRR